MPSQLGGSFNQGDDVARVRECQKPGGRLLAHLWLVRTGSVVFTSLRLAFACSGTVRYVTPAPVVRHQPAPGF